MSTQVSHTRFGAVLAALGCMLESEKRENKWGSGLAAGVFGTTEVKYGFTVAMIKPLL